MKNNQLITVLLLLILMALVAIVPRVYSQGSGTTAFTYQGEAFGKRVKPLADSVGSELLLDCDVEDIASVDAVFEALKSHLKSSPQPSSLPEALARGISLRL